MGPGMHGMHLPWVILKTGSTLPEIARRRGDFEHWISEGLGVPLDEILVVPVFEGAPLPAAQDVGAVVVTGSPAMVTAKEPWSVASAAWLQKVWEHERPILGICYGHQLLADALGGRVDRNPAGREIGTVLLERTAAGREDPLLGGLDDSFLAQESHSEAVVELPPGATLIATNPHAPIQAFSLGRAWGVQFHPEFDADIVRGYIRGRAEALRREGLDPDQLDSDVKESDAGPRLLRRFRALVSGR